MQERRTTLTETEVVSCARLKFFVKTPHHTLRFLVSRRSCTRQTWLKKESSDLKIMESSTEDNQIHRSVLLDHKMIIEGIQYHEKKELQRVFNEDGVEMSDLSHMRSIGVRTYTANQKIVDGEVKDETIETTMAGDEIANFSRRIFKNNWNETSWIISSHWWISTTLQSFE